MILVGNTNKPKERKRKVLFINGKDDVVDINLTGFYRHFITQHI